MLLLKEAVSELEELKLISATSLSESSNTEQPSNFPNRRFYDFNWKYSGSFANIDRGISLSSTQDASTPMPEWARTLFKKLQTTGIAPSWVESPDHCMIGEYEPNSGLPAHVDDVSYWDHWILVLSLRSDTTLRMRDLRFPELFRDILVPRRSAYLLQGASRYSWTHEVMPCQERRTVIMWRNILPAILHAPIQTDNKENKFIERVTLPSSNISTETQIYRNKLYNIAGTVSFLILGLVTFQSFFKKK
jgi:alkylated DNA repair dioxygenase AlkB